MEDGEDNKLEMEADRFLQEDFSGEFSSLNILFLLLSPLFSSLTGVVPPFFEFPGVRKVLMDGVCFFPPVLGVTAEHRRGVSSALLATFTSSFLSSSSSEAQTSSGGSLRT